MFRTLCTAAEHQGCNTLRTRIKMFQHVSEGWRCLSYGNSSHIAITHSFQDTLLARGSQKDARNAPIPAPKRDVAQRDRQKIFGEKISGYLAKTWNGNSIVILHLHETKVRRKRLEIVTKNRQKFCPTKGIAKRIHDKPSQKYVCQQNPSKKRFAI